MITPTKFLIYGGLDPSRKFQDTAVSYDISKGILQILDANGTPPLPRLRTGLLSTGNGMVIMYGGKSISNEGYFTDLWHFTVKETTIKYKRVEYQGEGTKLFMSWRHGFSMHNVRNIKDPVIVGGTYGNNQQARVIVTLPEKKCTSLSEFDIGECSPCPKGSVLR